jgi:hypothetical protein
VWVARKSCKRIEPFAPNRHCRVVRPPHFRSAARGKADAWCGKPRGAAAALVTPSLQAPPTVIGLDPGKAHAPGRPQRRCGLCERGSLRGRLYAAPVDVAG